MLISIASITIPSGRRPARNVGQLAESIDGVGLINPITVTEEHVLVAGRNRLEACRSLGWDEIEATVVDLDGLGLELAEIDENLIRNELTAIERAEQMKRRKEIYEAMHPAAKRPEGGRPAKNAEIISTFADDTARKTGITPRSVRQDVQIATAITPEAKREIAATPAANRKAELLKLARHAPTEQSRIVRDIREKVLEKVPAPPSPKKAREIALQTGRPVAASNNKIINPISEEEAKRRSEEQFAVRTLYDAVSEVATTGFKPGEMVALGEKYFCRQLTQHAETAVAWLSKFIEAAHGTTAQERVS